MSFEDKLKYLSKIKDNWWMSAEEAVEANCADDIIAMLADIMD